MAGIGARVVPEGRLKLSRSPSADIAAAAMQAQEAAGLTTADFIVVAVKPGTATDAMARELERVATKAPPVKAPAAT